MDQQHERITRVRYVSRKLIHFNYTEKSHAEKEMSNPIERAGRELVAFTKSAQNDGVSVWVSQGRHHALTLMKTKPKGIPKLNSNEVYLMLE